MHYRHLSPTKEDVELDHNIQLVSQATTRLRGTVGPKGPMGPVRMSHRTTARIPPRRLMKILHFHLRQTLF